MFRTHYDIPHLPPEWGDALRVRPEPPNLELVDTLDMAAELRDRYDLLVLVWVDRKRDLRIAYRGSQAAECVPVMETALSMIRDRAEGDPDGSA